MEKHPGGKPSRNPSQRVRGYKLPELGISHMQSSRWQSIAGLPEKDFEGYIEENKQGQC